MVSKKNLLETQSFTSCNRSHPAIVHVLNYEREGKREGDPRGRRMRKSELVNGALGRANARMVRVEEQTRGRPRGRRAQKGKRVLGDAAPPWK